MSSNSFTTEFFNSVITSETSSRFSLSDYFQNVYDETYDFCEVLPCLFSRSDISVTAPFSYEAAGLNAFCLIHTTNGAGRLSYYDTSCELTKGTLAMIDCRIHYKLNCPRSWEYTVCFVGSPISSYYYCKLASYEGCVFNLDSDFDAYMLWQELLRMQADDETHALMRSQKLAALYAQLYLSHIVNNPASHHIPSYIMEMKKDFDTAFNEQYSLDALALKYRVNKYRLCREFAKYYEDTPFQYLNRVRIEKAKELLLHSDEKIGVIGQMVGMENANHFIRLFKEKTGVTPLTYRRETPV